MKLICKYNCECCAEGESDVVAVEATSNEQVKRFIYDFILSLIQTRVVSDAR